MKTVVRLYSRSEESDDYDPSDPPRDPSVVDIRDLCVPVDECVKVSLGPVDSSVSRWLAENRFDQAPVEVPSAEFGWRLIARDRLEYLAAKDLPLTEDAANYSANDMCPVGTYGDANVWRVLEALCDASAILVYGVSHRLGLGGEPDARSVLVYGLVTISDLNKQPVRLAVYDCLARLERGLANLISATCREPWDWIRTLGEHDQARILGYMELAHRKGMEHEAVAAAMLPQLFTVVAATARLREKLGFESDKECSKEGRRTTEMRNRVMHPVRPLVLGSEDVRVLRNVVERTKDLTSRAESELRLILRRSVS